MIEKSQQIKDLLFTLAYSLILISIVYWNTYLPGTNTKLLMNILMSISIILISLKIFFYDLPEINFLKINIREILLFILILLFTLLTVKNRYRPPFLVFLFVIGARNIKFNKIMRIYFYTVGSILLISIFASSLGFIINSRITRMGVLRQAFGYKYPTAFVNILNTVLMVELYNYFKQSNPTKLGIVIRNFVYGIIGIITIILCDTRADSSITFLLIPISIYLYINFYATFKKPKKILEFLMSTSFYIFGFITYIIVTDFIKNPSQPFLNKLDIILSRRLSLTAYAVQQYGYSWIGKKIVSGDIVSGQYTFYLDSNYYIFFLGYGMALFLLVGIVYYYLIQRELNRNNLIFVILLIILAFMGMIEEHFYAIETNPFLLAVFASMDRINLIDSY